MVPPLDVTIWRRDEAETVDSFTRKEDPKNVCSTKCFAISGGIPSSSAASVSTSIILKIYAGPLPEIAVAASIKSSESTRTWYPIASSRIDISLRTEESTSFVEVHTDAPCATCAGVLGITLTNLEWFKLTRRFWIVTPAIIETTVWSFLNSPDKAGATFSKCWGFIAKKTKSAFSIASVFDSTHWIL